MKFLIYVWCFIPLMTFAQEGFPVPEPSDKLLFYLQRTSNTNTLVYELNKVDGKLVENEPVSVSWIRYDEQGQRQELSYIQRKFAYGVKTKKVKDNEYNVSLTAYSKFIMEFKKDKSGVFRVYANANGKKMVLSSIFIKIVGGSMWSPDIEYFELSGTSIEDNKPIKEKMKVLQ